MADFTNTLKTVLSRSAKFIGRSANTAAKATKYKVNEITTMNKRRELVHELGEKVVALCDNGLILPAEANEIVVHIKALEGELNMLRSDHAAEKAAAAEQHALEKAARATEKAAAKAAAAIEMSTAAVNVEAPVVEIPAEKPEKTPNTPVLEVDIESAMESFNEVKDVPTLNV